MKSTLDKFGELLIKYSRDHTIDVLTMHIKSEMKNDEQYQKILDMFDDNQIEALLKLLPMFVDQQLFDTLFMFEDNEELTISYGGEDVESDGLHGEIFTEDGWIEKFSKYK